MCTWDSRPEARMNDRAGGIDAMLCGESNGHLWLGPETDDLAGPNRNCPPLVG